MREQFRRRVLNSVAMLLWAVTHAQIGLAGPPQEGSINIEPGAAITQQNWQQYREFMSVGLAALFEGAEFWHLPSGLRIEIGPTISIPLPNKYLDDTSKYSKQVRLIRTPSGGYVPSGYVAGLPFPHP